MLFRPDKIICQQSLLLTPCLVFVFFFGAALFLEDCGNAQENTPYCFDNLF